MILKLTKPTHLIKAIENLWGKYAVTMKNILAKRDELDGFLNEFRL